MHISPQRVKMPCRVRRKSGEEIRSILCQGMYLAQNSSQAASVEFVRRRRTNYARSRLRKFAENPAGDFCSLRGEIHLSPDDTSG